MRLTDLDGKAVCILGYRQDGEAVRAALREQAPSATITLADAQPIIPPASDPELAVQSGPGYLEGLDRFDVIVRAPGIKDAPQLAGVDSKLTTSAQIFFDTIADRGVTTVGVTGSKGKSTTTNLIATALRAAYGEQVSVMGNIGVPMISRLHEAVAGAYFVIELSSYQLESLTTAPHIAVLTSLFPEHLDRHGSLAAYQEAKTRIARLQKAEDFVFFNALSPECEVMARTSPGLRVPVQPDDFPAPLSTTRLQGAHNLTNLALAYRVAVHCGVPPEAAVAALQSAEGLPYRLHSLGMHSGVEWIDDSLATAPEPTMAALQTLGDRVDTILVGGQDRGFDFSALGRTLAAAPVRNIVLFPDTGANIRAAVEAARPQVQKTFLETRSMAEAVEFARSATRAGSVCLLSSASPSYSVFRDHADKSRQFAQAIFGAHP